jgi:hypothetical protein
MILIIFIGSCSLIFVYYIDGDYYNPPFTSYDKTVATDKLVYHQGETIVGTWKRCLNRKINYNVVSEWTFVDGLVYNLVSTASVPLNKLGCGDLKVVITKVPENLPPGKYILSGVLELKVNPVKIMTYERVTNEFEIIK